MNQEWNLSVLYKGFDDPDFRADIERVKEGQKKLASLIEKKADMTAAYLEEILLTMEEQTRLRSRIGNFIGLNQATNTDDGNIMAEMAKFMRIESEGTGTEAAALKLLGSIENLEELEKESEVIKAYDFLIRDAKDQAKHLMSNEEEALTAALDANGASAWSNLQSFMTSTLKVDYKGETVTLSQIRNMAYDKDPEVRKAAYEAELAAYEKAEDAVAFALNNIKNQMWTLALKRGFESPLAEALHMSRMSRETLDAMMEAVREYLPVFRKYFRHKAEKLGHTNGLPWYDLFAPLAESDKKYTVEECRDTLLSSFGEALPEIAAVMKDAFDNEWIDFFPRSGKEGGAFDCGLPDVKQSRILTNFDGSFDAVDTLAHELGHAFHDRQVQDERPMNCNYPMPVAETASTFNEIHLKGLAVEKGSETEKMALLEADISGSAQCVVDIYSRYLFETAVYEQCRDKFLMAADLKEIMLNCQDESYGEGLDHDVRHPYMWLCKGHYYISGLSFYNFPYTFGELFAQGIYAIYKDDPENFIEKYKAMLRTTPVHTMEENGQMLGIDITKKAFWEKSLGQIAKKIELFLTL